MYTNESYYVERDPTNYHEKQSFCEKPGRRKYQNSNQ